ncbi:MAG TPA: hypothetical protein DIT04_07030 [Dysgonomonas sp.]|nr:hypothetical protein [Dysgonomonas sp.]
MRNLFVVLSACFVLSACSSDDPIDNGGNGGNGNGKIPPKELEGTWYFERYYYEVEVPGNKELEDKLKRSFDKMENSNIFPKGGYLRFLHGKQQLIDYFDVTEGFLYRSLTVDYPSGNSALGDYFTKKDTIFYYRYAGNYGLQYMLKKGNLIQYIQDETEYYRDEMHSGKGVEKVIYYIDYVRK